MLRREAQLRRHSAESAAEVDRAVIARYEADMRGIKFGIKNISLLKTASIGRSAEVVRRNEEQAERECQRVKGLATRIEAQLPFYPQAHLAPTKLREVESAIARIKREAGDCSDVFDRL